MKEGVVTEQEAAALLKEAGYSEHSLPRAREQVARGVRKGVREAFSPEGGFTLWVMGGTMPCHFRYEIIKEREP